MPITICLVIFKRPGEHNPSLSLRALARWPINLSQKRTKSFANALC
jgi:hypothetical protein